MISDRDVCDYERDGVIVVPQVLDQQLLTALRLKIAELTRAASSVSTHNDVYDLEPGHTPHDPRVRRIKSPHKVDPLFYDVVRQPQVTDILKKLLGPDLRLHGSKLNMKSAHYGSPVEWHQDWAFYPHTNDDILAIGVMLDDTDMSNGPMLVCPDTHRGEVWNHHDSGGYFGGMIDPDLIQHEISLARPCLGKAGSMSFHHVRALHGSALNTSDRQRNLLLFEVAAADAWPLAGVKDLEEFDSRMLAGATTLTPRVAPVPVRMPLPPPLRQGSIYETQSAYTKTYFSRAA